MQLSKRLKAVADLVSPGCRVADVGCDHAYIPIYLAENKISPHIIAMDINQGPIDRAKENVIRYGFENQIETRRSDGLAQLNIGEVDSIIIAGMGGALTAQILTDGIMIMKSVRELILQPQSEVYKVRHMLKEQDFLIIEENMVIDDSKYYVMMKAVPGGSIKDARAYNLTKKEHYYYGRLLLEGRHPVLKDYLTWESGLCHNIMQSLPENKLNDIKDRMELVTCALRYYDNNLQEEKEE